MATQNEATAARNAYRTATALINWALVAMWTVCIVGTVAVAAVTNDGTLLLTAASITTTALTWLCFWSGDGK